ncbi:AAA family ATPase [Paraburkholderia aspalathi]|nr:helicase RepA family protein [Paraburkholderia aspalathi]MBK3780149.1 AAA family ATPase [Paraburkholderia aspalathi]
MPSPIFPSSSNIAALLAQPPAQLAFVLPGLKRGSVGALISPGGTGKSYWALELAVAMSGGADADLTGLSPATGRVLFLSAEDDEIVLAQRIHAIARCLPEGVDAQRALARIDYRNCVSRHVDVMDSGWMKALSEAACDTQLVILDTLTRFHGLDENSALDMKRLLAVLEQLASESGATVLFLHHASKAAVMNGMGGAQQAARGSSVLIDNARWAAFLAVMTEAECRRFGIPFEAREQYVRWNVSKQNYAAPMADRWYRRADGGVLLPVTLTARARADVTADAPNIAPDVPVAPLAQDAHVAPDTPEMTETLLMPSPAMVYGPGTGSTRQAPRRGSRAPAAAVSIPSAKNAFGGNW